MSVWKAVKRLLQLSKCKVMVTQRVVAWGGREVKDVRLGVGEC